jgi:hypothetical protein
MKFVLLRSDEGSVTPLILGFAIVFAAVIATLSDLNYLGKAHLALKSEGQAVLAQSMRHLSSEVYYKGTSPSGTSPSGTSPSGTSPSGTSPSGTSPSGTSPSGTSPSGTSPSGTSVPIDCGKTYLNILNVVNETRFYVSNEPMTIRGFRCENSWIEFEISATVLLPFYPSFLANFDSTVTSHIRGGSRYFSD